MRVIQVWVSFWQPLCSASPAGVSKTKGKVILNLADFLIWLDSCGQGTNVKPPLKLAFSRKRSGPCCYDSGHVLLKTPGCELGAARSSHVQHMKRFCRAFFCRSSGNAAYVLKLFLSCAAEKEPIIKALSWNTSCVNTSVHFSLLICYSFPSSFAIADYSLFLSKRIFAVWSLPGDLCSPAALCSSVPSPRHALSQNPELRGPGCFLAG